jgi:hypothetical protein
MFINLQLGLGMNKYNGYNIHKSLQFIAFFKSGAIPQELNS